jgi:hypothetical protein
MALGVFIIVVWLFIIVSTITTAVSKGYNGFLAFLLGLFIPLFGSLIIIILLPDKNILERAYSAAINGNSTRNITTDTSSIKIAPSVEHKRCEKCGQEVNEDIFACPKCGNKSFK